jgi:hypothetical protein
MRNRLRFDRRGTVRSGGGVVETDWAPLIASRWAYILPTRATAAESVVAGRMTGNVPMDIYVRRDSATIALKASDRAVDLNTGVVYNLGQPIDPFGDREWLLIQATTSGQPS